LISYKALLGGLTYIHSRNSRIHVISVTISIGISL